MSRTPEPPTWTRQAEAPRLAWLDAVLTRAAGTLGASLRRASGRDLGVAVEGTTLAAFGELGATWPKGSVLVVARAEGLRCPALLVAPPRLLGDLTDAFFGGQGFGGERSGTVAAASPVARRLARRLGTLALDALNDALAPVTQARLRVTREETEPALAAIMRDSEQALVVTLRCTVLGRAAPLQLILPHAALSSLRPQRDPAAIDPGTQDALARHLADVEVEVVAALGGAAVLAQDLLQLQVGDVIQLDRPEGDPVDLLVEGRAKLKAEIGVARGHRVARIVKAS